MMMQVEDCAEEAPDRRVWDSRAWACLVLQVRMGAGRFCDRPGLWTCPSGAKVCLVKQPCSRWVHSQRTCAGYGRMVECMQQANQQPAAAAAEACLVTCRALLWDLACCARA
jgi:hypothetical protein